MQPDRKLTISNHAVDRYQQRVADVDRLTARRHLHALGQTGKRRPRPRHWTRPAKPMGPGTVFIYHPQAPDICLVVRDNTIVTVYSRPTCRQWRQDETDRRPVSNHRQRTRRRTHHRKTRPRKGTR